jgi:PilZ domain
MTEHPVPVSDSPAEQLPPREERRVALRFPTSLQTAVLPVRRPAEPEAPWQARVRDVSAYGLALMLPHPVEPSTVLTADLESPEQGVVRNVLARVVHVTAREPGQWVVGCALISEMSDEDLGRFHAARARPAATDCRAWVRFPCNVETVCYSVDTAPAEQLPARILNISAGGVGLLVPCQFESKTLLNLQLPPRPRQPGRKVLVRVVQGRPFGNGDWYLGCEFADRLTDAELEALR